MKCDECKGNGFVQLLTTAPKCTACGGSGKAPPSFANMIKNTPQVDARGYSPMTAAAKVIQDEAEYRRMTGLDGPAIPARGGLSRTSPMQIDAAKGPSPLLKLLREMDPETLATLDDIAKRPFFPGRVVRDKPAAGLRRPVT